MRFVIFHNSLAWTICHQIFQSANDHSDTNLNYSIICYTLRLMMSQSPALLMDTEIGLLLVTTFVVTLYCQLKLVVYRKAKVVQQSTNYQNGPLTCSSDTRVV